MLRKYVLMIVLSFLFATVFAEDWLEGGYVGSPSHGEIRQYFTDPIFYSSIPISKPIGLYSSSNTVQSLKPTLSLGKYSSKYSLDYLQSPSKTDILFQLGRTPEAGIQPISNLINRQRQSPSLPLFWAILL